MSRLKWTSKYNLRYNKNLPENCTTGQNIIKSLCTFYFTKFETISEHLSKTNNFIAIVSIYPTKLLTFRSIEFLGSTDPGAGLGSFATAPFGITTNIRSSIESSLTTPLLLEFGSKFYSKILSKKILNNWSLLIIVFWKIVKEKLKINDLPW